MTTVFIGGSRAISRLNKTIRQQLDELIAKNCEFYIGDANGADRAVQQYLAEKHYRNVTVFCMDQCRNNVGNWPTNRSSSATAKRDYNYFSIKDREMASKARCGVMLWDGKSRGTLQNILRLFDAGKPSRVYLSKTKQFYTVRTEQDLYAVLQAADAMPLYQRQLATTPSEPSHQDRTT